MILDKFSISGFRGVRDTIDIDVPNGFLVISGRNGTGKSTLCDAIEFCLTGHISKYDAPTPPGKREYNQATSQYYWWRGRSTAPVNSASVTFRDQQGPIEITRTPNLTPDASDDLADRLYDSSDAPPEAIRHLCQTLLIRDEAIADLSLDLRPRRRFDLVREAVSTFDFSHLEKRLGEATRKIKEKVQNAQREYQNAEQQYNDYVEQLAAAQNRLNSREDTQELSSELARWLHIDHADPEPILEAARERIATYQSKSDRIRALERAVSDLQGEESDDPLDQLRERRETLNDEIQNTENAFQNKKDELQAARDRLDELRADEPHVTSLAELVEIGRKLGLQEGSCPLCGSEITQEHLDKHLTFLEEHTTKIQGAISLVRKELDSLKNATSEYQTTLETLRNRHFRLDSDISDREERLQSIRAGLSEFDNTTIGDLNDAQDRLKTELDRYQNSISELTDLSNRLETSRIDEGIEDIRRRRDSADAKVTEKRRKYGALQQGAEKLKSIYDSIRRLSGELTGHQINSIQPLLQELYSRMRPHADWESARMIITGDVERSLGLSVEGDRNPSLMFSSGQRRAAGLAFLIAVNLARSWSYMRGQILDDPVQHVDDFRALQVVETLASLRRSGRQVMCTVEDPNLARLLCRRLKCQSDLPGKYVELGYVPESGVVIRKEEDVHPSPRGILAATG